MVGDLFFLLLKSEKSAVFEHKRGVPGKGKTENFGCFMAFSCSPNSPNREFKTKKHPSFSGVDLLKNPLYTSGVRRLCFIFATANASLRNEMTLFHPSSPLRATP